MLEMHVKPEHVTQAVRKLLDAGMTVTDLYSVSKTAIDIANTSKPKQEPPAVENDAAGAPMSW